MLTPRLRPNKFGEPNRRHFSLPGASASEPGPGAGLWIRFLATRKSCVDPPPGAPKENQGEEHGPNQAY